MWLLVLSQTHPALSLAVCLSVSVCVDRVWTNSVLAVRKSDVPAFLLLRARATYLSILIVLIAFGCDDFTYVS